MNLFPVLLPFTLLSFFVAFTKSTDNNHYNNPTHFTGHDDVSINCGSIGTVAARSGREWIGDGDGNDVTKQKPKHPFLQIQGSSTTSTVKKQSVPHNTARLSRSRFSYAFRASPGPKIIRLHFHSAPYRGFTGSDDLFTVEAGPFILLTNFSASLTADALGATSFSKEFCLTVHRNQQLNLTFSPETNRSPDTTFAFINGIQIISVPESLSYFRGDGDNINGVQVVGHKSTVHLDHHTALELIHRLNTIERASVQSGVVDFDDSFPAWALRKAGELKNKTWIVAVDVGFRYMIRLHFSGSGEVAFRVLVNGMIAQITTDLVAKERYMDCIVMMRGGRKMGKRDLSISLHSHDELVDGRVLLAAFEVFKISNPDNSLASPNPLPRAQDSHFSNFQMFFTVFHHRNVVAFVVVIIISLASIVVHQLREYSEANDNVDENKPSARAERLCRRFSLAEIQLATRNFSDGLMIGRGGFGNVYKGLIDRGQVTVAVKRLKSNSMQGVQEFLMEIETLSELRHANLVSLIGYCNEHREMILVYDYMAGGTLSDQLYKFQRESGNCPSLTWKQRLSICIGAGRGLDYLHTGHGVIHRDVKTSNILLDETLVAKVSDFGLAKQEDRINLQSHVSTRVKGTHGYLDPHYLHTRKLTRKTDTYAFGVVLFEILCGRRAVDLSVPEDEHILIIWARNEISKGEVNQIVDVSLGEDISPASLDTFVGIAERCMREDPKNRPTMSQVVQHLELALDQQDNKQLLVLNETATSAPGDDIRPSISDESGSLSRGQYSTASTSVPDLRSPPQEQTSSAAGPSSVRRARRSGGTRARKPLRVWPWEAFWNRVKPSKKKDLLSEIWEEADIRLTKYDWDMIADATDQFAPSSKIGEGGFGTVYKGVLTGQAIAVKSFSPPFGFRQFKKMIAFVTQLRHRNIITLLGYCISKEDMLLVYEFMENGSLDTLIADEVKKRKLLQWESRLKIITGIARGVVYLQQYSGLILIHRKINLPHILLDCDMNPKIYGFDIAMNLDEDYSNVTRIGGACFYMAPEYPINGIYSFKTDVFSFGISILEIISGRRVNSWIIRMDASDSKHTNLHDYVCNLWNEGRACDFVDESLEGAFSEEEALRCIQIGLLCTNEHPVQRPEMTSVVKMLEGDEPLVDPQHPWTRPELINRSYSEGSMAFSDATFESDEPLGR